MAIGKQSDFILFEPEFHSGFVEVLAQNANAFNAASQGGIRLETRALEGQYEKQTFFGVQTLDSRRDLTSVSAADDIALTQTQHASVKRDRKIGPVAQTENSWTKIGSTPEEMSFVIGQMSAKEVSLHYLNSALIALDAATPAALTYDGTSDSPGTLTTSKLVDGLAKFGDRGSQVVCWVMHSKPYYDLVKEQIASALFDVTGFVVRAGSPVTFGKPVIVTDSSALVNDLTTDTYETLGLVMNAAVVTESEAPNALLDRVSGLEQIVRRFQMEYAYNLGLKGYTWDIGNGGANPTDAAIATASNWDAVATSNKDKAAIKITTL